MQISQHYAFSPFNGHFPRVAELANTRLSPFWILLHLRMMELVVTTGAKRRAKLQSNHHHQQTNTQLFTGQMPFLSPTQQCQSTEGETQEYAYTDNYKRHNKCYLIKETAENDVCQLGNA